MRWQGRRKSSNVEDRRGFGASGSRRTGAGSLLHPLPISNP